ncbi:MAG: M20 family metallopeptidase, partial [Candidatus Levyibacteriota bacterium]
HEVVQGFPFTEFASNGIKSLLIANKLDAPYKIIFNAHLDVVPGNASQFTPLEKDGKIYGRGAYDMKAAAAVMTLVFRDVAKLVNYPFALQLVTDEEIGGHNGTKYQFEKGVTGNFALAGENTDFAVKNKAKGILWIKLSCRGKTTHGAYPWDGDNALQKVLDVVKKIEKQYPNPSEKAWQTTVNLARIETSNKTFNKVSDDATVFLDIRFISEDEKAVLTFLETLSDKDTKIEIELHEPAMSVDLQNEYMQKLQTAIAKNCNKEASVMQGHGASDIRFYTNAGIPATEFGPRGGNHHAKDEWVDIQSLFDYYHILKEFLLSVEK